MHDKAITPFERAKATLLVGAVFFCMRSCEYLNVSNAKQKKTKALCLRNIRFFRDGTEIKSKLAKCLRDADIVSITFEDQKNGDKFDTVNLQSSNDPLLCPLKAWANTVSRISEYPGTTRDTPVNVYMCGKRFLQISDKSVIQSLRSAVHLIGEESLGFKASEVGTHSIRAGGAMAMYLAHPQIPTYTIQLIGRWRSDAFLKYIRKQVKQFTAHISNSMVENEGFSHIPEYSKTSPTKIRMAGSPKCDRKKE